MLISATITAASDIEWTNFLNNPTNATYDGLSKSLKACNKVANCIEAKPDAEMIDKLIALLKSGNSFAVDVAFLSRSLNLLDGGALEDVLRTLGQLAESHPKVILKCLKKYKLSGYPFEGTFVILPIETVDDLDAQIDAVQRRINSLSAVDDPSVRSERDKAISVLKRELNQLKREKRERKIN
jgi:hypothetical protein